MKTRRRMSEILQFCLKTQYIQEFLAVVFTLFRHLTHHSFMLKILLPLKLAFVNFNSSKTHLSICKRAHTTVGRPTSMAGRSSDRFHPELPYPTLWFLDYKADNIKSSQVSTRWAGPSRALTYREKK